jgi:hypothetical protein
MIRRKDLYREIFQIQIPFSFFFLTPLSRQEEPIHSFQEQPPAAIIKNGALSIAISNDISEALLDRIFQVIRHA